ncbi:MAG TPA: hypothetical protein VEK15_05325 [Vicinamibacteria bacterium]|nr:hypothetical protein [Vicinamibacteria bacterium]
MRARLLFHRHFVVGLASMLQLASCDAWLHSCLEIGAGERKLTKQEVGKAVELIERFIAEENLDCTPIDSPIGMPAEDSTFRETHYCIDPSKDRVRVEFAFADDYVVVEFTDTGRTEPEFMKRARETLLEQFAAEFGNDRVALRTDCYKERRQAP